MPDIVYAAQFAVLDFAGFSFTGSDYSARFLVDFDIASQFTLNAVMSDAPAEFPTYVRGDPQDKVIPLHILIDKQPPSQNLIDALKSVFTPSAEIDFLRVRDENGNIRRMRAKSLGLVPWEGHDDVSYVASLEAPEPVWEDDTPDVIFYNVSGNAGTTSKSWEMANAGNEECYPVVTMTPYANRSGTGAGQHQLPIVIAWRSSLEGVDSQGLPYPIDVTDGLWDTQALPDFNGTGSAAYVRAWLDGVEISRYIENPFSEFTSVWCSIPFQPTRQATLFAGISNVDTELSVTNADDLAAFPDIGFVLMGAECVAYQGRTATSLLALKRAQRGTSAAAHPSGQLYWVEHDIRLTWGDAIPFVAGMELADEKPIIDLAASTNLHHKYGTADGLIEPDTLRSGQWVRELRAPAGGRRAQYSSLSQAAGVVTVTDQLPEVDAPNFDSLSLYTPCFTSSNVTGVAMDVEVDHHMLMNFYGVDEGGFESLLWKQSIRGPVGPVFAPDKYHVDTPSVESITILPGGDLARLTIEGRTSILTGVDTRPAGPLASEVGPGALADLRSAQIFTVKSLVTIDEIMFFCSQQVTPMDGLLFADLHLPDKTEPHFGVLLWETKSVTAADIPVLGNKTAITIGQLVETKRPRMSGAIAATFDSYATASVGAVYIWKGYPRHEGGSAWRFDIVSQDWIEEVDRDLQVCLISYNAEPQDDAVFGTDRFVSVSNVDVHFNPAFTPLIEPGAVSPCYILNEEVLTNADTGESLTLTGVLPIADASYDVVKIDASGHVITTLRDGVDEYEQPAGYFSEPSNIMTWLRLVPGVNHLTLSNLEGGPRLAVRVYLRSRWT